jgi:hypothetical protein
MIEFKIGTGGPNKSFKCRIQPYLAHLLRNLAPDRTLAVENLDKAIKIIRSKNQEVPTAFELALRVYKKGEEKRSSSESYKFKHDCVPKK